MRFPSSNLRASSPRFDPGDLPLLGEAMAGGPKNGPERTVLALKRPKTDRSSQTPHSQSQRVGVRSPDRCLVIDPDCQRCALASVPYGSVIQGTLVVRSASSPDSSAPRPARALPDPLAWSALPRWAAHWPGYRIGSRRRGRRHVRAAGFSWTSPAALGGSAFGANSFNDLRIGNTSETQGVIRPWPFSQPWI